MPRKFSLVFVTAMLLGIVGLPVGVNAAPASSQGYSLDAPARASVGEVIAVTLNLPPGVAAVDGRVFLDRSSAELIGVAPTPPGIGLRPVDLPRGYGFGAYALVDSTLPLIVNPTTTGAIQVRVIIDDAADRDGNRIDTGDTVVATVINAGNNRTVRAAGNADRRSGPRRGAKPPRDVVRDGKINIRDVDNARGAWDANVGLGTQCADNSPDDVNGDGCMDIVDLQLLQANQSKPAATQSIVPKALADVQALVVAHVFTVNSTGDGVDATPGDGICATSGAVCTLRAAMMEAEYSLGDDRVEFNLTGTPPVRIQLGSRLPMITSSGGSMTIDGYTEPGSHPNTAQFGSNAVQGVEIRGNGNSAREVGIYITSANNVVRGLQLTNLYRPIFMDGANATNNSIVGNFVGFNVNGTNAAGQYGLIINTGAHDNHIGSSNLADRNVIGYAGIDNYGPGTNGNIYQGNQVCILPNGNAATCSTGIDHNFGPKNDLVGGTNPGEGNVFGPSTLQCIEYSHGWNPADHAYSGTYAISGNRVVGNWAGFRQDGTYSAAFRCGLNFSSSDNGQAINVYDGAVNNIVESNFVASVYDGIQVQSPNASGNIVRNNTIGVTPQGAAAPLTRWGIIVRWGTSNVLVQGNTIRNAAAGGIGLISTNNSGTATSPATSIKLTQNIVSDTNGQGIDLVGLSGPDPNDAGDADTGPNEILNTPVITSASTAVVSGTATAGATVELYRASRNAGLFGLPTAYLGTATANGSGAWSIATTLLTTDKVTALQFLPDWNTSELSANVAVHANTAPVVDTVTIDPSNPTTGQTLTATVTSHDVDNDPLTTSYQWTKNGTNISGATTSTLNLTTAGNGDKGDVIRVIATVSDGQASSAPVTSSPVTVVNTAPTATVGLTPANPSTTATLTATATRADADADTVTLTYVWKVNGSTVKTTANSSSLTDTLDLSVAGNGDPGDVVSVEVTPNDGTVAGTMVSANQTVVAGPTVYANDPFSRTVANGWGAAPTGGAWSLTGTASDFAVNGSAATINLATPGANRAASLIAAGTQDVDLSFEFAMSKAAVGGNHYVYGIVRRINTTNEYRAKVRIATNGAVFLQATQLVNNTETSIGSEVQVAGLTATPGAFIRVRAQFQGTNPTTIRMRAWADGSNEPGSWQYTQTNSAAALQASGAVGVRVYVAGSITNAPLVATFDDFSATSIQP